MGFYIRNSVRVGPFRLNLSKSGVGISVGVKGFRVGVGPSGRYIHMGLGGLYYRKTFADISGSGPQRASQPSRTIPPERLEQIQRDWSLGPMREFRSVDALSLTDSDSKDLINELNSRREVVGATPWAAAAIFTLLVLLVLSPAPLWISAVAALPLSFALYWLRQRDEVRQTTALFYSLDGATEAAYRRLCEEFEALIGCGKIWRIDARADVYDRKYHAGAHYSINRTKIEPSFKEAPGIRSNIAAPAIPLSDNTLYLFPDRILVLGRSGWGTIGWDALHVWANTTRFIESDTVPHDAKVVDRTWRFVNKNGDPDRRFNNNHEIPVCLYGELALGTETGLTEILHISNSDCASAICGSLLRMTDALEEDKASPVTLNGEARIISDTRTVPAPQASDNQSEPVERVGSHNSGIGWIVSGILVTAVLLLATISQPYFSHYSETKPLKEDAGETTTAAQTAGQDQQAFNAAFDTMIAGERQNDIEQISTGRRAIENLGKTRHPAVADAKIAREKNAEGTRLLRNGAFEAAAQAYAAGFALNHSDVELADNLGYALYKSGRLAEARDTELRAIRLAPSRFTAWGTLAGVLASLGEVDTAEAAFGLYVRMAKSSGKALASLRKQASEDPNPNVRLAAGNTYWRYQSTLIARELRDVYPMLAQFGIRPLMPAELIVITGDGQLVPLHPLNNNQFPVRSDSDGYSIALGTSPDCLNSDCYIGNISAHRGASELKGDYESIRLPGGIEGRQYLSSASKPYSVAFEYAGVTYGFAIEIANSKEASRQAAESALRLAPSEQSQGKR